MHIISEGIQKLYNFVKSKLIEASANSKAGEKMIFNKRNLLIQNYSTIINIIN